MEEKRQGKFQEVVKNFEEIPGEERKKTNSRGVVKVLMEFQGVQFLKMDILNMGVWTISGKSQW